MTDYAADSAKSPSPDNFKRRLTQPLSQRETLMRAQAMSCAADAGPACTGQLFVGLFFDGTGNNEDADYTSVKNDPKSWKHSNVVRLFHAWPEQTKLPNKPTTGYFRHYIQGVGTPFGKIGDSGGGPGGAAAWNGEPRIIWGLIQVLNSIHAYYTGDDLIPKGPGDSVGPAGELANKLGGATSSTSQRNSEFKGKWLPQLQAKIALRKPKIVQINLSVFGFSRGAAEARAFINWFYELCESTGDTRTFAGIPVRTQFMGLFDTVASVGVAGMYDIIEGHQSWASHNLQIPPAVENCVHMVAAHEQRACFPLDSVRVDGKYPASCREYVYPGMHSDVGGGYEEDSQGKRTSFARIPGFEMYCEARAAGVPLLPENELDELTLQALKPPKGDPVIDDYARYMRASSVADGPLEDMVRGHMRYYLTWRQRAGLDRYARLSFMQKTKNADEKKYLYLTQKAFCLVLAGISDELQARCNRPVDDDLHLRPLEQPFLPENFPWLDRLALAMPGQFVLSKIAGLGSAVGRRKAALASSSHDEDIAGKVSFLPIKVQQWRYARANKTARDPEYPELRDASAPDRDVLNLIEALMPNGTELHPAIAKFFDTYIHDSMAGFAARDKVNEFVFNGIGMAKFRRTFFGNHGDKLLADSYADSNKRALDRFESERKQLRQWDREAAEYRMTR